MSNDGNRKSMDDVLASIRRIVTSEKNGTPAEDAVVAEDAPEAPASDEPLALTPDMRTDAADEIPSDDEAPAVEADTGVADAGLAATETAQKVTAMPDASELEDLVRTIVREEIEKLGFNADMIRNVLTEELTTGETGNNISTNVMRLIQAEVGKALGS